MFIAIFFVYLEHIFQDYTIMKALSSFFAALGIAALCSCGQTPTADEPTNENTNQVIETIMARRSIRSYQDRPVNRDTMNLILQCGVNAPNGQNKQSWQVRVVDNPDFLNGLTEIFKKENPKAAEDPEFKNMFRNAPTVVFIAYDTTYDVSQVDCGLLGENMILAAQSMGIGSCCLAGPVRFMNSPAAAEYLQRLDFPDTHKLLYAIAMGYPNEKPDAKPHDMSKVKFIE